LSPSIYPLLHSIFNSISFRNQYAVTLLHRPIVFTRDCEKKPWNGRHGTSLGSYITFPYLVDYSASKAAALGFHEGLAAELKTVYKASNVRTIVVTPAWVKTNLIKGLKVYKHALEPEALAKETVKAVLSGRSGQVILPKGSGWLCAVRAMPNWVGCILRNGGVEMMRGLAGEDALVPQHMKIELERKREERENSEIK
jgi:NAD(P)-dependent dehydrogenase (short-subunit alcohol dehydrogenase family)